MIEAFVDMLYSPLALCISLVSGFVLGSAFFLSLWWVVFHGLNAKRSPLWFIASFITRIGLCLLGFYLIAGTDWQSWLTSLLGFIIARPLSKKIIDLTNKGLYSQEKIKDAP